MEGTMTDPVVLRPGEGTDRGLFGSALVVKASGDQTGGAYSLIEAGLDPGGAGPLPHKHLDREESFYVLDGEFVFHVGDDSVRATAGTFLLVPRGVVHTFSNGGETRARLVLIHSPSFEGYFEELRALADSGATDPAVYAGMMSKWGMEVVSP
jgi:mannose-6-phosphate isomerase-like protein (cupin superfamily)